jgi:menaquinol-cytochrome c reductase iron-sulfur subunit
LADSGDSSNGNRTGDGAIPKPDPPGYFEGESMTRRRALTVAAQGIGGLAGAAVVLPAIGFAIAPIFHRGLETWESVGTVDRFTEDDYRTVVFTIVPGIGESGKTTAFVRKADPRPPFNEPAGSYVAVSSRCAHLGCPVRYVSAAGNFICPCHGGVYDFEGKVIGGPPVRPLDRFQTRVRNGQVQLGPRYSVTNQLQPVRARDPGEYTGGIWNVIYPPRPSTFPPPPSAG